ncbi:MAG: UDP-N-acetylmuramoyl-L-alanyl-D-glutamate--2,6-diaminopimelate ligase [Eubacteriaceae bacterium]|nr:UDP-N-acetylmuramoyl-L-alanyl-D-glutamate--2,6-diaminopimelate ligase [Eubacteriaceae bacterium]
MRPDTEKYIETLEAAGLVEKVHVPAEIKKKEVEYISYDSQDIKEGTLFVCKGAHFSSKYLAEALKKGAFIYISETEYEENEVDASYIIVNDIRKTMALIADLYYDRIWQRITTVGITGTKGKSTTAYFMRSILDDHLKSRGKPFSAIISGIDNYDGVITEESHLTTPEAMMLHRHFDNAVKSGIEYVSMEVSSQALKYDRTMGITFDIGCFLNLGEDHISPVEHPSVEDYMASKMILMHQCKTAVINIDSRYGRQAADEAEDLAEKVVTFGEQPSADIYGYDVEPGRRGTAFRARGKDFDEGFKIGLTGLFNVSNALAAIAMSHELGIPIDNIKRGLEKARVSGRMEIFTDHDETMTVIVDYAHNKMSFEALFESVKKEYPGKKIMIVFGCPGKKAQRRRKELGQAAGKYCSKVFITEEDAGEEPVLSISNEIAVHVKEQGCPYEIIEDRGEAIRKAIEEADANTVLLLTGKGRETRQKRGIEYIDTPSDVEYVERYLGEK